MDGDKAKSPPDRDSETARRALFESAMFMGQNPYALASSDPATAYAQLAAAQMQAYSAMMARHPAFAAAPYSGLGMYPEGLGSPLHSPMNPAFLPGGAEYWHAATTASEHARQLASSSGYDYFASSLNSLANSFSSSVTGLGTVSDAINFEALLRDPTAAQKSFGLYGNPFLMPPYCSMVTMTTTSTSSAHSSPLKQTNAKTTVTSSSTATRSSPAATVSKAGEQTSGSKHRPPELSVPHETTKDQPPAATLPPPAHSSASKSTLKSTESEDVSKDSDDDFLAKEVLNHLKNQQAEFMRREHVLKLQHNAESAKAPPSSVTDKCEAQRELAAEMLRKRQHEHLVNQLRSSQYDAMPNLRKFAEQQMMKTKGKDGEETTDPESSKKQSEAQGNMSSPKATSEQQEYPNKKKLADQIRDHVHKKATCSTSPPLKIPGRPRGRPKSSNKTLLKIPCTNINSPQAQKHKQDDLRERLEAELKQQQLQLKMAKKGLAQHSKEHEKSKGKDGSKLAQVLLGKTASPPPAMQVETSADRPLVATFKTLSSTSTAKGINDGNSDSSSNSSSGSDSEDSSSESSSGSDSESGSNSDSGEPKTPAKRKVGDGAESSGTDGSVPVKKSREVNEEEVRIPLEHGWRRETRIRTVGQRGIVGDVVYYAPCGKMLKSLLEINKYLATNGITDLTRENFNFSTRVGIGDFLELSNDGNNGMISLSEQEVQTLLSAAIQRRPAQRRAVKRTQQKKKEAAKMAAQEKIAKKIEQQEIAKFAMEQRQKKKGEREMRRKEKAKVKLMREQERLKQKERFKQLRQREKQQRQEEMRMERELRAQQLLEAKKRRKEELQNQKYAEAMKKAKERELKRQQAMMLKEQERERRRQHLLLLKALEARKKLEERERMREEKNRERVLLREKKMEQRRLEIQMAYEMKRPVDDLRVKDCKDLPKLDRIPGVKLAGRAFADALMTLEFLHNFGDALDLDDDVVPSLNSLQLGLLNEEDHVEDLLTLLAQLLKLAIDDPGVPNPKEATTKLNQKIGDVDINDDNVSEVLRIFMEARNGKADELSTRLRTIPFQALNATDKSSCLAFLCNELLCSNTVTGEIEESIENISNLRKDKWSVEGKLRNLKAVHAKKINKPLIAKPSPPRDDSNSAMTALSSKQASDDEEDESGHESGADGAMSDGEENASMPVEELEKKIEKLSKQQGQFRSKVFDACRKLRAVDFGVDRYKRRYWVLPHAGGIFVEGVESGDVQEYLTLNPESEQETLDSTKEYDVEMKVCKSEIADWKPESGPIGGKSEAVSCQSGESKCEAAVCKMESNDAADKGLNGETVAMAVDSARVCNDNLESKLVKKCDETAPKKADVKVCKDECVEQKPSVSPSGGECAADCTVEANRVDDKRLAMTNVKIENGSKSSECNSFDRSQSLSNSMTHIEDKVIINGHDQELFKCNSSLAGERSDFKVPTTSKMADVLKCNNEEAGSDRKPSKSETPGHDNKTVSVTPESKKSTNISLNQTLDSTELSSKMDTSSDGSFLSPYYLPGIKQGAANEAQWFSILPKIACDDQSITSIPPSAEKSKADVSGFPPFGFSGQMFSPVSMGQLHNSPFGYGMLPLTSSPYFYQSHASSTRAPSESSMDCTNLPPTQESLHQDPLPIPQGMQNGWWRITDPNQFKALLRCLLSRGYREKHLQRNFQKNMDFAIQHCGKGSQEMVELDITANDREISQNACSAPTPDKRGSWNREVAHDLERSLLDDVESLEERVFNASLQVKGWKLPEKASGDDSLTLISNHEQKTGEHQQYIVEVARTRLAKLETNIERRYLKPPLNKAPEISLTNHSTGSGQSSPMEEEIPKGLAAWRQCVAMATSPSQLSLCMVQLNSAISWEKSVMKVLCQICRLDDNEAELLLCDSCDKGYHTYCFKPPMTDIPDGDWFCYECVSRANKVPHCVRCGKKNGRMAICNNCPVAFHIDCIDPPFQRTPRKWICGSCTGCKSKYTYQRAKYSKARKKQTSESTTEEDAGSNVGSETCPTPEKKSRKSDAAAAASTASTPSGAKTDYGDKAESPSNEEPTKNVSTDFSICWSTLSELEKHPDSKPFHMPVNCKKFPSYRKFIKKPMDFSTLKKNLNNKVYKVTSEFAADVRQIFDNCEVFNEDDSEVGMAGHALRKLFEERWTEFYTDA